jgi:uncharacterized protein YndB with AHSA1/START domain
MTTDKAHKRAVRTRMRKTGERYAAARRHLVGPVPAADASPIEVIPPVASTPAPAMADPGWPDETIVKGTGHDWAHWLALLDASGAMDRSHTEIARWLVANADISGWWAQTVTVGYERARGRRAIHQTSRGFEVSVSKTIRATRDDVWTAVVEPERRAAWVESEELHPTTSRHGIVARFAVAGGPSTVEFAFDAKAPDRTTVTVTARKLADGDAVERHRVLWRERLRRLDAAVIADTSVAPDVAATS